MFFWDKVERANFFLNNIIETVAEDAESRLIQALLNSPLVSGHAPTPCIAALVSQACALMVGGWRTVGYGSEHH